MGTAALLLAALVGAPDAVGGGPTVVGSGTSFTPSSVTVSQGTTVTWVFSEVHSTTSNQRFWDSGRRSGTYRKAMPSAGKFPYHCTVHAGMKGRVVVRLKASGSSGGGWTVRWSESAASNGRAFDVQFRRQGTTAWQQFRTNTTAASGFFNPSRSGTYQLRARTSNTAAGKESGWSPTISRQIS